MRTARRLSSLNSISYSYTDDQVFSTVRFAFAAGIIVGAIVAGLAIQLLA